MGNDRHENVLMYLRDAMRLLQSSQFELEDLTREITHKNNGDNTRETKQMDMARIQIISASSAAKKAYDRLNKIKIASGEQTMNINENAVADRIAQSVTSADSIEKIAKYIRGSSYDVGDIVRKIRDGGGHMPWYSDVIGSVADYIKKNSKTILSVDKNVIGIGNQLETLSRLAIDIGKREINFVRALNAVNTRLEDSRFMSGEDLE